MTYDEAKEIALQTVTPRLGETRRDTSNDDRFEVVGFVYCHVVLKTSGRFLDGREDMLVTFWRNSVRNGRFE